MKTVIQKSGADRLGSYLTVALGASALASTSDAAIVNLNVSGLSGINGGLALGASLTVDLSTLNSTLAGSLVLQNQAKNHQLHEFTGISGSAGSGVATNLVNADPVKFSAGNPISADSSVYFASFNSFSVFRYVIPGFYIPGYSIPGGPPDYVDYWVSGNYYPGQVYSSQNFGPGSFLGFVDANGRYGWLEVTWDNTTGNFEILSAAFESIPGVAIPAGAVAAVPEPAGALGTLGLLAAGAFVRRRQRAA